MERCWIANGILDYHSFLFGIEDPAIGGAAATTTTTDQMCCVFAYRIMVLGVDVDTFLKTEFTLSSLSVSWHLPKFRSWLQSVEAEPEMY